MASQLSIQRALRNAATTAGQAVSGDLAPLASQIAQLPAAMQSAFVAQISRSIESGQYGALNQSVIDLLTQSIQPQVSQAVTAQTQTAGQPAQQTAPTAAPQQATLTAAQVPNPQYSAPTPIPAGGQSTNNSLVAGGSVSGSGGLGTPGGANTPGTPLSGNQTAGYLQTYQQNWQPQTPQSGSQQLAYLSGYLGVSPEQVQQGYNQYMAGTREPGRALRTADDQPQTMEQWVASQITSIEGKYEPILNAYEQSWEQTNQGPMPPELRQQLRQQLQNMPPAEQQLLDSTLGSFLMQWNTAQSPSLDPSQKAAALQSALSLVHGNLPFLDATFNNYQSAHPSMAAETAVQAQQKTYFIQTYYGATGRWPTQPEIDKYATLPTTEQSQYIDNQNMANLPMTYADYQATLSLLNSGGGGSGATGWNQAFGRDPTPEQVYAMKGMNPQDIRSYIDNSPSREIPGMNIGTYTNLQSVGSDISTKLFGTSDSSQLIKMFHEANQKT